MSSAVDKPAWVRKPFRDRGDPCATGEKFVIGADDDPRLGSLSRSGRVETIRELPLTVRDKASRSANARKALW